MHSERFLFKNSEVPDMPQFPKGEAYANLPRDMKARFCENTSQPIRGMHSPKIRVHVHWEDLPPYRGGEAAVTKHMADVLWLPITKHTEGVRGHLPSASFSVCEKPTLEKKPREGFCALCNRKLPKFGPQLIFLIPGQG